MPDKVTRESLDSRQTPQWFADAKLGIFIHWGLFSVPGWAPLSADMQTLIREKGMDGYVASNPYAEWYLNSMKLPANPTFDYHRNTFGSDFSYFDFQQAFETQSEQMNPDQWAQLFAKAGARYVVMVSKHCDGYPLWPTRHLHPQLKAYYSKRDFVGEVSQAVRNHGLRMGIYYSGVFDWSFRDDPITDMVSFLMHQQQSEDYTRYAVAHWLELIERYQPSVLWNDIGFPSGFDVHELQAQYYASVPDGVVNDRWSQLKLPTGPIGRFLLKIAIAIGTARARRKDFDLQPNRHYDYRTPEYKSYQDNRIEKWETCRGIGQSFGYNRLEQEAQMISGNELIWLLCDIVSKNGNLLINVGPMADGTIPELQQRPLLALGTWLTANGEAIYDTHPWRQAETSLADGTPVRFTSKDKTLFAIIKAPGKRSFVLPDVPAQETTRVSLPALGHDTIPWEKNENGILLHLPDSADVSVPLVVRID